MKVIKDYLHLYLGCETSKGRLIEIRVTGGCNTRTNDGKHLTGDINEVMPILRPLSDISKEEASFIYKNYTFKSVEMPMNKKHFAIKISERISENSQVFTYLLKQGFDLFGLIDSGLAIDKTTLTT